MKRNQKIVAIGLFALLLAAGLLRTGKSLHTWIQQTGKTPKYTVVIDPGHGGTFIRPKMLSSVIVCTNYYMLLLIVTSFDFLFVMYSFCDIMSISKIYSDEKDEKYGFFDGFISKKEKADSIESDHLY